MPSGVPFDWTTQVIVPFGVAAVGAVIGAGAVLWASRRQIEADAATVQQQFAEERKERERERATEFIDLMIAAREEARINVNTLQAGGAGRPLLATEFLRRVFQAGRIIYREDVVKLSDALVTAVRYNATAELWNSGKYQLVPEPTMQAMAGETNASMAQAQSALSRNVEWGLSTIQGDAEATAAGSKN
jgi:hypothetical protein